MRILLISSSSGSKGGGEIFLLYLAQGLKALGHTVALWCSSHQRMDGLAKQFAPIGEVLRSDYQNTYDLRGRSLEALFRKKQAAEAQLLWEKWNADIWHLNKQNLEDGFDLLRIISEKKSLPPQSPQALSTIHITQPARFLKAKRAWLRDITAQQALRQWPLPSVAVSDKRAVDLKKFLGNTASVHTIYNGVSAIPSNTTPVDFEKKFSWEKDQPVIISVGRLVPQKNPFAFLNIAKSTLAQNPHARFLWIGDGELHQEWDTWVEKNNLTTQIKRVSWQNNVPEWLLAADIYLHTARYEGLPLAILEALSTGLPCILPKDMLAEADVFAPENNVLALNNAESIPQIIKDETQRKKIAFQGNQLYQKHFSIQKMSQDYLSLYSDLLKK